MDFDFNLILVPVTLIFFLVWLLDKFVFKQRATKGKGNENFVITLLKKIYFYYSLIRK